MTSHIFNQKHFQKLDSPFRKEILPADLVCKLLELEDTLIVADVGSGTGFFTFPFAEKAKLVHAIDISDIMTNELTSRINDQTNIHVALGDFNDILSEQSIDVFFTSTVIHELDNLEDFTKKAIKKLKNKGRVAYLDFEKIDSDFGPPVNKRIAAESVMTLFEELGLSNIQRHKVKDYFYLVVGTK